MATPDTPDEGFPQTDAPTDAMFAAQEQWEPVLDALAGMVEQTRRVGFTKPQARAIVAAAFVNEVAKSVFVNDGESE